MDKIDFVIIWVNGNDPEWRKEFKKYKVEQVDEDTSEIRFRDWDNLRYWFRGVEKYAPWVNKIHFVTCGHYPDWLNLDHPKLNFVKHSNYIPTEFLPTFNSHTIELNLHRIKGLSEQFVYFNDDTFLANYTNKTDFFRNGLPCDMAVSNVISPEGISHILLNNLELLSRHFSKRLVLKENFFKWFNLKYGFYNFRNFLLLPWPELTGFFVPHQPQSFLKVTFTELWKYEEKELRITCKSRFRNLSNVNQYLFRWWQLLKGQFKPCNIAEKSLYLTITDDTLVKVLKEIKSTKKTLLCINDGDLSDFVNAKKMIIQAFEDKLPNRSTFEI